MAEISLRDIVGKAFKAGNPVVLVDNPDRENEGDLVIPASLLTVDVLLFFLRHSTGQVCVAANASRLDQLDIPLMTRDNRDPNKTAFCISVDLSVKHGITTGVSAEERVKTINALADKSYISADFNRPGHVFPLREHPLGLRGRQGHTEGSLELCRLAGYDNVDNAVAVIVELMHPNGKMMRFDDCASFASEHKLPFITMKQLIEVSEIQQTTVKLPIGIDQQSFETTMTVISEDNLEYIIVVKGDVVNKYNIPLRIHSECLTGDVLRSSRCDCGSQLRSYTKTMADSVASILIYIKGHEGRGIGLHGKIMAYSLQDQGYNTMQANTALGYPIDAREYGKIPKILERLGVKSVNLYSNNPSKIRTLGKIVSSVTECKGDVTVHNKKYLETKKDILFPLHLEKSTIGLVYTIAWHHSHVMKMVDQCRKYFKDKGHPVYEQTVSGAFELVMGAKVLVEKGCQSVIAIGILLKGDTYHFDVVSQGVTNGLMALQLQMDIPIILGIIACYTPEQIVERVDGSKNTVDDWCKAAVDMAKIV